MSLSTYDVSVGVFQQTLGGLAGVLEKAEAHCREKGVDEAALLGARLAEDMQPLTFQVMQAVSHSAGAVARLHGQTFTAPTDVSSLAKCRAAVDEALASLEAVKPADLEGAEAREVTLQMGQHALKFPGQRYLLSFALPNFFFHVTTAYDVLRNQGVAIGKRDFMGPVQLTPVAA